MTTQAKQRRRELQKVRALLTYQEQKYRREKRIKSKRWALYRGDTLPWRYTGFTRYNVRSSQNYPIRLMMLRELTRWELRYLATNKYYPILHYILIVEIVGLGMKTRECTINVAYTCWCTSWHLRFIIVSWGLNVHQHICRYTWPPLFPCLTTFLIPKINCIVILLYSS